MTSPRQAAAAFAGLLAVYVGFHAAMAGYALYLANKALSMPGSPDMPYLSEIKENCTTVLVLFLITILITGLAGASSVGFLRRKVWAQWLCFGTGALLVGCVLVGVVAFGTPWTNYWFEVALALVACWYAWSSKGRPYAG